MTTDLAQPARSRLTPNNRASLPAVLTIGAVVFSVVLGLTIAALLHHSYRQAEAQATLQAQNLATLLAANLDGQIEGIDLNLQSAKDAIEDAFAVGQPDVTALTGRLGRLQDRTPLADALRATDADGIATWGRGVPTARVSLADRDYFNRLRGEPGAGLVISEPTYGRITQEWGLLFARRFARADASFGGVVFARVNLTRFRQLLASVDLGTAGLANLRDASGAFITGAMPGADVDRLVGRKNLPPEMHERIVAGAGAGSFYTTASFDGIARTVAFHAVGRRPLYVSVGLAASEYLSDWKREALTLGALGVLFAFAAIGSAVLIGRTLQQRLAAQEAFAREEERARVITAIAYHDPLTGLPNRRLLDDRLAQVLAASRRSGRHGALLFADLDNFKPLNDRYGHALGDRLLVEVAARLAGCIRESDTVARLGGDEFVVMIPEVAATADEAAVHAGTVATKILETLARPYELPQETSGAAPEAAGIVTHHCSASIGIAVFDGTDDTADAIVRRADQAMYAAKSQGRGRMCFAAPTG